MKGPSDFESGGRMSTYMLNETKGRERERCSPKGVNGSPSTRIASDGDHHGAVTESRCRTQKKCSLHSRTDSRFGDIVLVVIQGTFAQPFVEVFVDHRSPCLGGPLHTC